MRTFHIALAFCLALTLSMGAAPAFAAPASVVEVTATSAPNGNSHAIGLGSVAAGNRLLMLYAAQSNTPRASFPAGWTRLYELLSGGIFAGQRCGLGLAYLDADGTEGTSVNLTTPGTPAIEAVVYRIMGHDAAAPPAFGKRYGNNGNPGSDTLFPPWGIDDTLWIAAACKAGAASLTAFPTNYVNDQYSVNDSPLLAIASRVATVSAENFGGFTTSGGYGWSTFIVGIKPSP